MGIKFGAHISSHRLSQRISSTYPLVTFLSQSSNSDVNHGMKLRSRSEENLTKLSDCMNNMDDDVSKLFMEFHQTDFRQDPDLLRLLNEYFTTSKRVTELCESLRIYLDRAKHDECALIDVALCDFQEEKLAYGSLLEASFRKTISDLRNFDEFYNSGARESDSDFVSADFIKKTQVCHGDLAKMIVKLEMTMKEIDKKLRRVRGCRAIVAAAVIAPVIAVVVVSKVVAGLFGSVPLEPLTTFASSKWKKSTEGLKREKTAMTSMERESMVALKGIEKISTLVCKLENVERSIRVTAESAVKKRSYVALAMGGMETQRKKLKSTLVDLDRETGRCNGFVELGRNLAREKIAEFLSRGEKSSK